MCLQTTDSLFTMKQGQATSLSLNQGEHLKVLRLIRLLATVQKIVSEILPPSSGMGFTKDARDLLIECCVEFITLISSEANEISEKESKKTIAVEHITKALEQLGFGNYVADINEVANEHKEQLKVCFLYSLPRVVLITCTGTREESKQTGAERHDDWRASGDSRSSFQGGCTTTWLIMPSIMVMWLS